ncbi:MAG: hypothetical protein AAF437_01325 [Pseudomonadota bacterium]
MLLRRITKHVKDQNWFAVGLDFLIVVIGVFIGIQVANWNEARQESLQADLAMERIVEDIASARELAEVARTTNNKRLTFGTEVAAFIEGQSNETEPTSAHCDALAHLHNWSALDSAIASFDELVATGQTALIREDRIRRALTRYSVSRVRYDQFVSGAEGLGRVRLPSQFPKYFTVQLTKTEAGTLNQKFECDFPAMRGDASFRVELANMLSAISWYDHNLAEHQKKLFGEFSRELEQR